MLVRRLGGGWWVKKLIDPKIKKCICENVQHTFSMNNTTHTHTRGHFLGTRGYLSAEGPPPNPNPNPTLTLPNPTQTLTVTIMCFRVLIVWCFQTLIGKFHISPPHPSQSFEKLWICGVFGLVLVLVRKGTDRHRVWCKKRSGRSKIPILQPHVHYATVSLLKKNKPALGSWMVVAPEGALEYLDWRGGRPEASNHLENPHLKWKIWNLLITRSQTSSQGLHCSLIWSRQCWHIPSDVELWDYTIWNLYKKRPLHTELGAICPRRRQPTVVATATIAAILQLNVVVRWPWTSRKQVSSPRAWTYGPAIPGKTQRGTVLFLWDIQNAMQKSALALAQKEWILKK